MTTARKYIAHLDLDCFFVSIERIKNPSLIGKPVVVGGTPRGRGVVASASYEARAHGVRSAMPTAQALKLCPQTIVVPWNHEEYAEYSRRLYRRMLDFAPIVEPASIDEMYMDFTGCEALYDDDLPGFMKTLQKVIRSEFKLPCTIALASNKLVAKVAADTVKPEGVIYVPHGTEKEFLSSLPIEVIPGVGKKTGRILEQKGFHIIADLHAVSREQLVDLLGAYGNYLHDAANGIGSDTVVPERARKSISREETFSHDIADIRELQKTLFSLVESVCSTLRSHHWKTRTVTLKLRYTNFKTITRRQTIEPSNYDPEIFQTARSLLQSCYDKRSAVRLLGVGLSQFVDEAQPELPLYHSTEKKSEMLDAVDRIREKFGEDVIHLGRA